MGYSHRLYLVDNETLDMLNNIKLEEFHKWGIEKGLIHCEKQYLPLYEIGKKFFDFGKYYENSREIQNYGKPLFKDEQLKNIYEEYEPHIVGKEAVLNAIEYQKNCIIKLYENMLLRTDEERYEQDFDDRTKEEMYEHHLKSMYSEWKNNFKKVFAINLDETNPAITTSWKYEYAIFELVRLYKTTDWENNSLIFMGW